MEYLSKSEILRISNRLEDYHKVFYVFFSEISSIYFDKNIPTAAIYFSKVGKPVLKLGKEFWSTLNDEEKHFVICHECLHVMLKHDMRNGKNIPGSTPRLSNVAQDITINEMIVSIFGYDRSDLREWKKYCWIETCFEKPAEVLPNQEFTYYLKLLIKESKDNGKSKSDDKETVDDHSSSGSGSGSDGEESDSEDGEGKSSDELADKLKKAAAKSEKDSKEKKSGQNKAEEEDSKEGQDRSSDALAKKIAESLSEQELKDLLDQISHGPGMAGTIKDAFELKTKPAVLDFKAIVKHLKATQLKYDEVEVETFKTKSRRFTSMMNSNPSINLPGISEESRLNKSKLLVAIFMDVSGSCIPYIPHFKKIVKSFELESEYFEVILHTFDTEVTKIDQVKDYYSGGGNDSNRILEEACQEVKAKNKRYPDGVIVITDGYFFNEVVVPEHPKRWVWLLTKNPSHKYIHQKSSKLDIEKITFKQIDI
jgi:predicted metal-dependent peptidase